MIHQNLRGFTHIKVARGSSSLLPQITYIVSKLEHEQDCMKLILFLVSYCGCPVAVSAEASTGFLCQR